MLRIGIDTGGTFTDFVICSPEGTDRFKVPSTPSHPAQAILAGLASILEKNPGTEFQARHGSTVATNTLLERKGAKTALITNQGFEDVLEIGRQNRPHLYQLSASRSRPLVPSNLRVGMRQRSLCDGSTELPLEKKSLDWLQRKVKQLKPASIAVVLLYSYLNPESEEKIHKALAHLNIPISLSHQVLSEYREYERTSATVINAYLTPTMGSYLQALQESRFFEQGKLSIMQSNGGSTTLDSARSQPIRTLLSGPAGGVVGAFKVAERAGFDQIVTLDMGGTSTDVSLCDKSIRTSNETIVDQHPVPVQTIDIKTVGAGGGSIAWVDEGGLLRVGPQSAGADPGPLCYGKGKDLTVTDAHLFLGRIAADFFLGGELKLDPTPLPEAFTQLGDRLAEVQARLSLEEIAEGIVQVATTQMERALRIISLERGYDTEQLSLVSFGGAGGLHACSLAQNLLIPRVIVPPNPGLLSALGVLGSDQVRDRSQTVLVRSREPAVTSKLSEGCDRLEEDLREQMIREGFGSGLRIERSVDVRYVGQAFEINVPFGERIEEDFHAHHEQSYGYCNKNLELEFVNIRVRCSRPAEPIPIPEYLQEGEATDQDALVQEKRVFMNGNLHPTRFYLRDKLKAGNRLAGPAVIVEYSSTTLVPPGFDLAVDRYLNLLITPVEPLAEQS